MGSPLSPIITDIALQDLENRALSTLKFTPSFYFRYVDDVALAVPSDLIDYTLNIFNSFHTRLQFTVETGLNNSLNFLDITMFLGNNRIIYDWYHKETFSGRYLNFLSQHPLCQKRGTVIGLLDRAFLLSHPRFHSKNINLIIQILLNNSYPLRFIFQTIHHRLKLLINNLKYEKMNTNTEVQPRTVYFTIPSIPERFIDIIKDFDVKLSYFSLNKLHKYIKTHKDITPKSLCKNVVYRINCLDCDASYVGQTRRQLTKRISEHRNHINRNTTVHSVVTDHRINFNHNFNWEEVEILDSEPFLQKRLLSKMIFIKRQVNSLNLQTDTECLPDMYMTVIDKISKL
ncbi:hypothetical protein ACS0PU_004770 [Formica fusca]